MNQHHERYIFGLLLIISLALLASPQPLWGALLLTSVLPGYALLNALFINKTGIPFTKVEYILLTIPVGYALTTSLMMAVVYSGLPLNSITIGTLLTGFTIILMILSAYRRKAPPTYEPLQAPKQTIGLLLIVLSIAAFFRLYNLHYSDYQGDEAGVLLQAISLFQGDIEAIMTRFKGPGEVLTLNAFTGLLNNIDETTGRTPFAIAGAVAMGLVFLLGQRMAGLPLGFIAAMLGSIEGVFVSYARTAQYQSVNILLTVGAMFCYYRYHQQTEKSTRLHALGTFLMATGFLYHFEVLFFFPVVLYLTCADILHTKLPHISRLITPFITRIRPLWPSVVIFLLITASFYLPFLLHPSIEGTGNYLENRISSGDAPPFNNFDHVFQVDMLKYNSLYYGLFINLTLMGLVLYGLQRGLQPLLPHQLAQRSTWLTIGSVGLTISLSILFTVLALYQLSGLVLAIGTGLFLLIVILAPQTPHITRILWLWIAPAGWVYLFLVNRPGKHHYLYWSAIMLLVAWAWVQLSIYLAKRFKLSATKQAPLFIGIGLGVWVLFAGHTYMLLLRVDLEYMLTYPQHQSQLYITDPSYPYRTRIGFGYPYRLGWQTIGQLVRTSQLSGTWSANDQGNSLTWYMLNRPLTNCYPRYLMQGEITYKDADQVEIPFFPDEFSYQPRYRIWGNDRLRLTVLEFDPDHQITEPEDLYEPTHFPASITPADFPILNERPAQQPPQIHLDPAPVLGEGSELKQNAPAEYLERAQQLEGRIALLGYDLETQYQSIIPLTLHWHTLNTASLRYKVFIHLIGTDGTTWTQADDFPVCGTFHANSWPAETTVIDRHLLKLPADFPDGIYRLSIGMYEPDLNLRLNYFDIANNEQGNSLTIDNVIIQRGS